MECMTEKRHVQASIATAGLDALFLAPIDAADARSHKGYVMQCKVMSLRGWKADAVHTRPVTACKLVQSLEQSPIIYTVKDTRWHTRFNRSVQCIHKSILY